MYNIVHLHYHRSKNELAKPKAGGRWYGSINHFLALPENWIGRLSIDMRGSHYDKHISLFFNCFPIILAFLPNHCMESRFHLVVLLAFSFTVWGCHNALLSREFVLVSIILMQSFCAFVKRFERLYLMKKYSKIRILRVILKIPTFRKRAVRVESTSKRSLKIPSFILRKLQTEGKFSWYSWLYGFLISYNFGNAKFLLYN